MYATGYNAARGKVYTSSSLGPPPNAAVSEPRAAFSSFCVWVTCGPASPAECPQKVRSAQPTNHTYAHHRRTRDSTVPVKATPSSAHPDDDNNQWSLSAPRNRGYRPRTSVPYGAACPPMFGCHVSAVSIRLRRALRRMIGDVALHFLRGESRGRPLETDDRSLHAHATAFAGGEEINRSQFLFEWDYVSHFSQSVFSGLAGGKPKPAMDRPALKHTDYWPHNGTRTGGAGCEERDASGGSITAQKILMGCATRDKRAPQGEVQRRKQ